MPGLTALEVELERAFRRYHFRAQIVRFLGAFLTTLAATLASGGYDWTVSAIAPVIVATAWTVAREMWPTVPWPLIQKQLRAAPPPTEPGPQP